MASSIGGCNSEVLLDTGGVDGLGFLFEGEYPNPNWQAWRGRTVRDEFPTKIQA
jgi:hypothetical protein